MTSASVLRKLFALNRHSEAHVPQRNKRRAYVCDGGQVRYTNDVGYSTYTGAFFARPMACKYCVFERVDGTAELVNMYNLAYGLTASPQTNEMYPAPDSIILFATVEAAIMYALMTE